MSSKYTKQVKNVEVMNIIPVLPFVHLGHWLLVLLQHPVEIQICVTDG